MGREARAGRSAEGSDRLDGRDASHAAVVVSDTRGNRPGSPCGRGDLELAVTLPREDRLEIR